jgi:hypothetical protein
MQQNLGPKSLALPPEVPSLIGGDWAVAVLFGKTVLGVGVGVGELPPPPQPTTLVIEMPANVTMATNATKIPENLFMVQPLILEARALFIIGQYLKF